MFFSVLPRSQEFSNIVFVRSCFFIKVLPATLIYTIRICFFKQKLPRFKKRGSFSFLFLSAGHFCVSERADSHDDRTAHGNTRGNNSPELLFKVAELEHKRNGNYKSADCF